MKLLACTVILAAWTAWASAEKPYLLRLEGGSDVHVSKPEKTKVPELKEKIFEKDADEPALVHPLPWRGPTGRCGGKDVYVLDYSEARVTKDGKQIQDPGYNGSAGMPLFIYLSAPASDSFIKVYDDLVLAFYGTVAGPSKTDCPVFAVRLHGSELDRPGYQFANLRLQFDEKTQRYELIKKPAPR